MRASGSQEGRRNRMSPETPSDGVMLQLSKVELDNTDLSRNDNGGNYHARTTSQA